MNVPQYKILTITRVIKYLKPLDRVTMVLEGRSDVPEAVIKFHSPKQMTRIGRLNMQFTGDAGVSMVIDSNPGFVRGNVIHVGDFLEYKDFVIAPNATMECRAQLYNWTPEQEFPDLTFAASVVFDGPLEVID